jgi:hypothetical protein
MSPPPAAEPRPPEVDLTRFSEEALFTLLDQTLERLKQAPDGPSGSSPETLVLCRHAVAISERIQWYVNRDRERLKETSDELNHAETALAKAMDRKEDAEIAAERMKMLSSRRASLASPDDVLKASVDAELASRRLDQKKEQVARLTAERDAQRRALSEGTGRLERAQDRIRPVRASLNAANSRDTPALPTKLAQPGPEQPASKDSATTLALAANPFELFTAQASRPTGSISNLSIQMLILPLRQKLDELEKRDPTRPSPTDTSLMSIRREIQQYQALLQGLLQDLNNEISELDHEEQSAKLRTSLAEAKLRAASAVVERNKKLNERKPGMVSDEDVAKAQAESDVERTQFQMAQFKETTVSQQRTQIESKSSTIGSILATARQALARTDPTPQKNAKP